jgi:hypothetical protein
MTTLSDALGRAPNPLAVHTAIDSDSGSEWVDLTTLHAEVRQDLWQSCERGRRSRAQVLALVGEPGSGKSHILQWLRQQVTVRSDPNRYLIAMPALPDLAQPFRHALRQLVGALCKRDAAGESAADADQADPAAAELARPIDRLLWQALFTQACDLLDAARIGMYQGPAALLKLLGPMCHDSGRKRSLPSFVAAAQKVWSQVEPGLRSYLLSLPTEMSIDSAARAVFLQFPYAERRALCIAWLAGEELSQKDRERISAKQVINNENAAKHVLCSLVRLLTATPGSQLILIYDQTQQLVEQLGQPGVQAMAEVASAINASGGTCLQVLSLRPATHSQLQERPARSVPGQGRPIDKTLQLGRAVPAQLRELIVARVAAGLAQLADRPSAIYPFNEADLDPKSWPKEADTPRGALMVFAERYAQRRREIAPGSDGSGRHATSTADKRPAAGRGKDGPSAPGTSRRPPSAQSPSLDFLSMEETGDAPALPPQAAGKKPRSLTHAAEEESDSGATTAPTRKGPQRQVPSFVADSSPTVQALPKEVVAAALLPTTAKARDLAREAKISSSFNADSNPTVQALSNDVMGKVRGPAAPAKRPAEPISKPPAAAPTPGRGTPAGVAEKGRGPAPKPAETADKTPSRPTAAAPGGVKAAIDPGTTVKQKVDLASIPNIEQDSAPTLKRMPDENLIKATREGSRPHSGAILGRITPISANDSTPIGRTTPTISPQAALLSATKPSSATVKPGATTEKPATRPPSAKLPPTEVLPPAPSNVPDPLPPSADSPSMGWLAMASGQDPLADAVKQAQAELKIAAPAAKPVAKPAAKPAGLAEPPRPSPTSTPPSAPKSAPAPAKSATSAVAAPSKPPAAPASSAITAVPAPSNPPAAPVKRAPIPATAPMPAEAVPTELPPSAESPSMGWLAMASGSSQLEEAMAEARSDLKLDGSGQRDKGDSGPAKAGRAARPVRDAGGVVVVNRSTVKAPEPAAAEEPAENAAPSGQSARSTKARLPAIQLRAAKTVSPSQVLEALSGRGMMEEWQLAQEMGIAPDALVPLLTTLEDEGQVRLMPLGDGQRMVVRID